VALENEPVKEKLTEDTSVLKEGNNEIKI